MLGIAQSAMKILPRLQLFPNEEVYETKQGCKLKFTEPTKNAFRNHDLIYQLDDTMDDSTSGKSSTKNYEPYEFTPLM